jgi:hypothetical protein
MDRANKDMLSHKISAQTDQWCPRYGHLKFCKKMFFKGVGRGSKDFCSKIWAQIVHQKKKGIRKMK